MEVVLYLVLLLAAFGGGAYLSWRLGFSNKFISNRQLDRILAEQRVMRNLMDEEIAIIARDNDKDLASFDRQLNPPKIETIQGELVPQLPSPVTNAHDVIYSREQRMQDEAIHRAFIKRMNEKANVYIQPSDHSAGSNLRARNLKTGIMTYGHSMSCNCDRCLPLRHTAETVNCGCTACGKKSVAMQHQLMADYYIKQQTNYMSGHQQQLMLQYRQTNLPQQVLSGMLNMEYCQICKGYCTASPPHQPDLRLSKIGW